MEPPNSPDQFDLVKKALRAGRKIEAIKLYREQTGAGLADAKAAVEAMEGREREAPALDESNRTDPTEAVRQALLAGRKIEAIKIYREQTGAGLAEAKDSVEAIDLRMRGGSAMDRPNPPDHSEAIREALFAGRKIFAIKLYREQFKVGLAEAKDAVEAMESQLRRVSPERFSSRQGTGFVGVMMACALVGLALWKVLR